MRLRIQASKPTYELKRVNTNFTEHFIERVKDTLSKKVREFIKIQVTESEDEEISPFDAVTKFEGEIIIFQPEELHLITEKLRQARTLTNYNIINTIEALLNKTNI